MGDGPSALALGLGLGAALLVLWILFRCLYAHGYVARACSCCKGSAKSGPEDTSGDTYRPGMDVDGTDNLEALDIENESETDDCMISLNTEPSLT